jgi:small conductance mechanosensitive channel
MDNLDGLMAQAPELVITYGLKAIFAVIIFFLGRYFANVAKNVTTKLLTKRKVDQTVVSFVANLIWTLVFVFAIIATLGQMGVQTASLVALIGAVIFRPCRVGDYVEAAGIAGVVDEISIFSTKLKTGDNKLIIAPNSAMMNGTIVNYSALDKRRIDLVIGVSYSADIALTKKVITDVLDAHTSVLKDPAYTVALSELANSSINFVVRPWVNTADYWPVRFELLEQIKIALDDANIEIPFPQMDVHVKDMPVN